MSAKDKDVRLAVLIDADNISAAYIKPMMGEITRYGNPTIKRIYGDWTKPQLGPWKQVLLDHAISPVQQFGYTSGKNATDSSLIIDAMDILYTEKVDGFCLVSSDSDFTRLATRLREAGKIVYGIGEKKTPTPFVAACDRFIFLEILAPKEKKSRSSKAAASADASAKALPQGTSVEADAKSAAGKSGKNPQKTSDGKTAGMDAADTKISVPENTEGRSGSADPSDTGASAERTILEIDEATCELISSSVSDLADEDGWAFLGDVGNLVNKKSPSFDARNYGFSKMSKLMQSLDFLECQHRVNEKNPQVKLIYVRNKEDN
ncbi:MAG: NYN domain-containing protein [Clostridiales bacterium]|nr:NYN domain-containing protein [Clostridiales bacterium]